MARTKTTKRNHERTTATDTTTTNTAAEDQKKKQHAVVDVKSNPYLDSDPDGTHDIARSTEKAVKGSGGVVRQSADEELERLQKVSESLPVDQLREQLLGTAQTENALDRLEALQKDDMKPDLSKLTERQQRALQSRKKRVNTRKIINGKLERLETKRFKAAVSAVQAVNILQQGASAHGMLEPENDMEQTYKLSQVELKRKLTEDGDTDNARYIYNLQLPFGPYGMKYDRSGRYAALYGQGAGGGGHVAMMDCYQQTLVTEFRLPQERIRDVCFLHNATLAAVAQKDHAYIYDNRGAEIHFLKDHFKPRALQFLPYHWLLASIGDGGVLKYQDTSTGKAVSSHYTKLGCCKVLTQNPANAVLHAGHGNGTVTLWSPATNRYLVKMLCHKGAAITAMAIDPAGKTMVTAGADRTVKVWDLRMFQQRFQYYTSTKTPATSLDISQRNMLAVAHSGYVTVWGVDALHNKVIKPYMIHRAQTLGGKGPIDTVRFRPFEDVMGIGHANGISSCVIPGSGEPSLDTTEYNTNPFQDTKQRREAEVKALLDKLSPEMITLDADQVGGIEESNPHLRLERIHELQEEANNTEPALKKKMGKRRGRSKIQSELRRKEAKSIVKTATKIKAATEYDKAVQDVEQSINDNAAENDSGDKGQKNDSQLKQEAPVALKRFF